MNLSDGVAKLGNSLHKDKYRPDIDGLRAVAVISVLINHAFPSLLPGGFIGVDIFFVISGYLITSILIKDINNGSYSIVNFYKRRVLRIFPALVVVLLFILLLGWYSLFNDEFSNLGKHILASSLFSENFMLWSESGYFDSSSELKPTLHMWSLAIEEQFYIFWPLLMYAAYKFNYKRASLFLFIGGMSFAVNVYDIFNNPVASYYSPIGRSWELMIGAILAYVKIENKSFIKINSQTQSLIGALLIVASLVFVRNDSFPGWWALLPTFGAFFIISAGMSGWVNEKLLSKSFMIWIGLISYPLYLWHWPLLSYAHIYWGDLDYLKSIFLVLCSFVAASLTFIFIEKPFRVRTGSQRNKIFVLVLLMISIISASVFVYFESIKPRLSFIDIPKEKSWGSEKYRTGDFHKNFTGIYPIHQDRDNVTLFIGDSHLWHYAPRIKKIIESNKNVGAVFAVGGGCPAIKGVFTNDVDRSECIPLMEHASNLIENKEYKTIVFGGSWNWYFLDSNYKILANGKIFDLKSSEGKSLALKSFSDEIKKLKGDGKNIFVVLDNPNSKNLNATGFNTRISFNSKGFEKGAYTSVPSSQMELQHEIAEMALSAGAEVIDVYGSVCEGTNCRVTTNSGELMYRDSGHFYSTWVIDHASFIDKTLK